jgi:outer membrane protein assembly factor BamD
MKMRDRILAVSLLILIPAIFSCGSQNIKPIPDAEDQFEIAKRKYQEKDWSDAIIEFQKMIFNYPGFAKADSAQFLLSMSYYNDKEYPLAAGEFNKMVFSFPTSPLTDDAMFYAGICALKQSPGSEMDQEYSHLAIERFQSFLDEYPESELVPQAEKKLLEAQSKLAKKTYKSGELYVKMKDYDAALIYLNEVADLYDGTPWAAQAFFLIGEVYLKQKKVDRAKESFQEFIEKYPQHKLTDKAKKRINEIEEK